MKRQIAVIGPTPEFVRWSIRKNCPLREDTDVTSVDQTEKRLRGIRAAGLAIGQQRVLDGIAVDQPTDAVKKLLQTPGSVFQTESNAPSRVKGFRLSDVFQPWQNMERVVGLCQGCSANVLRDPLRYGSLAGCHGWLRRDEIGESFVQLIDQSWSQVESGVHRPPNLMKTRPRWYGLWASGELTGHELSFVDQLLTATVSNLVAPPESIGDFCRVVKSCVQNNLTLDVELLPHGNSDGRSWTICRHCPRCHAPMGDSKRICEVCQSSGGAHPPIKRKVLGMRPYVDLSVVLGTNRCLEFLNRYTETRARQSHA